MKSEGENPFEVHPLDLHRDSDDNNSQPVHICHSGLKLLHACLDLRLGHTMCTLPHCPLARKKEEKALGKTRNPCDKNKN